MIIFCQTAVSYPNEIHQKTTQTIKNVLQYIQTGGAIIRNISQKGECVYVISYQRW